MLIDSACVWPSMVLESADEAEIEGDDGGVSGESCVLCGPRPREGGDGGGVVMGSGRGGEGRAVGSMFD